MDDYNAVSDSLKTMKTELVGFRPEMKSMESKIQIWSRNVNVMESRQSQLRLKLMDLGVNITFFSNQGTFVEGFQELISTPAGYSGAPTPVSSSGIPTAASLGAPTLASSSTTPTTASLGAPTTATSSDTLTTITLGAPTADNSSSSTPTTDIDNTVSTTAEVHAESTAETTVVLQQYGSVLWSSKICDCVLRNIMEFLEFTNFTEHNFHGVYGVLKL